MAEQWSTEEIEAAVEGYFDYVRSSDPPPKKQLYEQLHASRIPNRSVKSIELKFQNISAILHERGLPWTPGLAPLDNYQAALATFVDGYLDARREEFLRGFRELHPLLEEDFRGTWDKAGQRWAAELFGIEPQRACFYGTVSDASTQLPRQVQQAGYKQASFLSLSFRAGRSEHDAAVKRLLEKTSLWPDTLDAVAVSYYEDDAWQVGTIVSRPESRFARIAKLLWVPDAQYDSVALDPLSPAPEPGATRMADHPLNVILYGPPGTGKTYSTRERALSICGYAGLGLDEQHQRYEHLVRTGRIRFVTFHQSFAYEDFVEGIRPKVDEKTQQIVYRPVDGVFKEACDRAGARSLLEFQDAENVWKMSLVIDGTDWFDRCVENNEIRLGWGEHVDFRRARTEKDVGELYKAESLPEGEYGPRAVHYFRNQMQPGDIVIVADGTKKFRGVARVTGEYDHDPDSPWAQRRAVEWLAIFHPSRPVSEVLHDKEFSQHTLYPVFVEWPDAEILSELIGEALPHVLIIDEINRANVSKVLGELITLLETDKRIGAENEKRTTLPYSREDFGVPPNLFILGTMNTADRSLATLDIALRRRFEFVEISPDPALVDERVGEIDGVRPADLLRTINRRIEFLLDRDHRIGHAELLEVGTLDDLGRFLRTRALPLLEEYFHGDLGKVALVLGCGTDEDGKTPNAHPIVRAEAVSASQLFGEMADLEDRFTFEIDPIFLGASGQELLPYLQGILGPGA